MPRSKGYREEPVESLKDPQEAAQSLDAALEDGDREVFPPALRNIAEARGGMSKLAKEAELNRENLYRMLSENGNPELSSQRALLDALGFRLAVALRTS